MMLDGQRLDARTWQPTFGCVFHDDGVSKKLKTQFFIRRVQKPPDTWINSIKIFFLPCHSFIFVCPGLIPSQYKAYTFSVVSQSVAFRNPLKLWTKLFIPLARLIQWCIDRQDISSESLPAMRRVTFLMTVWLKEWMNDWVSDWCCFCCFFGPLFPPKHTKLHFGHFVTCIVLIAGRRFVICVTDQKEENPLSLKRHYFIEGNDK